MAGSRWGGQHRSLALVQPLHGPSGWPSPQARLFFFFFACRFGQAHCPANPAINLVRLAATLFILDCLRPNRPAGMLSFLRSCVYIYIFFGLDFIEKEMDADPEFSRPGICPHPDQATKGQCPKNVPPAVVVASVEGAPWLNSPNTESVSGDPWKPIVKHMVQERLPGGPSRRYPGSPAWRGSPCDMRESLCVIS
jgi:hypothetical protein